MPGKVSYKFSVGITFKDVAQVKQMICRQLVCSEQVCPPSRGPEKISVTDCAKIAKICPIQFIVPMEEAEAGIPACWSCA